MKNNILVEVEPLLAPAEDVSSGTDAAACATHLAAAV